MPSRKKFVILYPTDHEDENLRGKKYKPQENKFVVMNGGGVFYLVSVEPYSHHCTKLSNVLPRYDVVWK